MKAHRLAFMFILLLSLLVTSAFTQCLCTEKQGKESADNLLQLANSPSAICRAEAFIELAKLKTAEKNFDSATYYLSSAEKIYTKQNCPEGNRKALYKAYTELYEIQADYKKLLPYYLKLLNEAEITDNKPEQAVALLNISQVFNRLKQSEKGLQYTQKAVVIINTLPDDGLKAELLNKTGARYLYRAQDTKLLKNYDSAAMYVAQALELSRKLKDTTNEIIALTRLGAIEEKKADYTKAISYLEKGLQLCKPGQHNRQYITLYGDYGNILMKQKKFAEARRLADSCLAYSIAEGYPPLIVNAYALIYTIEEKAGKYFEALTALKAAQQLSDSLVNDDRIKTVNELERKYHQAKNEQTIKSLSQQRKIYLLLIALTLLGLLVLFFAYRQQQLKTKQKIIEVEQRLNRARMNPHFFFNTLTALQTMALQNTSGKTLGLNLSKFASIMRTTLESTYHEYVTIYDETTFLNTYLTLQQLRFPDKFDFDIQHEQDMDIETHLIPSMLIQPFVENSIEHGFNHIDYTGKLDISFSLQQNEIVVTVADNGRGIAHAQHKHDNHVSRAVQIVEDRLFLLNRQQKTKARFEITAAKENTGVVVKLFLPVLPHH